MNILICDDDREIVNAIEVYLKNEGYNTFKAYDGLDALNLVEKNDFHLIIMDIMMPKLDGMTTTMKIREERNIPIIMLSAKTESTDIITGLNFGADDYIKKPFNSLELVARVKAQLRRYMELSANDSLKSVLRSGGLVMDDEQKEVTVNGEQVKLTSTEYKILHLLLSQAGRVFSTSQIYELCWNEPAYNAENLVAVHIRRIREKIEINPREPEFLKVVWGTGYKIEKKL